jgi:nicotinamidase-related amidase
MEQQLPKENLAVLLMDTQAHFLNRRKKRLLIPNQIKIIDMCKENNIPLIYFEYYNQGETISVLKEKIKELPKELVRRYIKYDDSAFSNINFVCWLELQPVKNLLLMGVNACACVYKTAQSAIEKGYNVFTSENLIAGYCWRKRCSHKKEWYIQNELYINL